MRRRTRQRGYVLILTLVVLTIAGTLLAAACRASLRKAMLASRAERDLQLRWGSISCRAVLLPQAERVFEEQTEPAATVWREVRLGRERFVLAFGDEQAKANVNQLWRGNHADVERHVRALTQASGFSLPVELRPIITKRDEKDDEPLSPFSAFGQIFRDGSPEKILGAGLQVSAAENLTCWSDGTLNYARASRAALTAVCGSYMGGADVEKLLKFRTEQPEAGYGDALVELKLSERNRTAVEDLLTDSSTCYSLWVIAGTGGGARYELSVLDGLSDSDGLTVFSW
jgi:hypothetical protein